MTHRIETYRIRWQANGKFADLDAGEIESRIRAGRIVDGDRIARADGVFVRWWEIPRFAPLRRDPGESASAAAHAAAGPAVEAQAASQAPSSPRPSVSTDDTSTRDVVSSELPPGQPMSSPAGASSSPQFRPPSAGPRATTSPEAALRAAASRVEKLRSVDEALQRLQRPAASTGPVKSTRATVSGPAVALNAVGTTVPAAAAWESWLDEGPEAVRDAMMQLSVPDILGVPESASLRLIQDAYEVRKATIDGAWDSNSSALKLQASRVAHFDLQRILAGALKVLTSTDERALYDRKVAALQRAPRLNEVLRFSVSATGDHFDPTRLSADDEAVLKFAGFDTQKLRDAQPAGSRKAVSPITPNPPPPKRQMALGIGLAVAVAVALFALLPECDGGGESTDGEFRVIAP